MIDLWVIFVISLAYFAVYFLAYSYAVRAHEKAHRSICLYFGGKPSKIKLKNFGISGGGMTCVGSSETADFFDVLNDLFLYQTMPLFHGFFLMGFILLTTFLVVLY